MDNLLKFPRTPSEEQALAEFRAEPEYDGLLYSIKSCPDKVLEIVYIKGRLSGLVAAMQIYTKNSYGKETKNG